MPLPAGRRLGPYELVSLIGAGGGGEVYRARDSRLGRDVAVKIVASQGPSAPERFRRFEREARAIAALDDPYILAIHDLGMDDGVTYAVFELLEGETLGQRLARGPLTPRKTVEWANQICRGLAAAHARGILHRDLKPENLFVTREGRIKILDFGLAKLNGPAALGSEVESSSTRTVTEQGTLLGTVGYMSPEQARGQPADARSDVFALGATLYEMLSGRRAFEGTTAADTLAAILHHEPPEVVGPGDRVPPALGRVIHRCLEKDPEERFQSARDVAFALEAMALASGAGTEPVVSARHRSRTAWLIGAAGLAVLGGAAALGLALAPRRLERPLPTIQQLTFRRGSVDWARFTSDGKTVVYGAYWDGRPPEIFVTRLESQESRSLGLPPARVLAVSSRGELAIVLTGPGDLDAMATGTLARVSLSGGEPRRVLDDVYHADWSPDGRELGVLRRVDGVFQLEYPIGTVIIRPIDQVSPFRISPRGDKLVVQNDGLTVYDLKGRKLATLSAAIPPGLAGLAWDGDSAVWVLAGHSATSRSIWRVTLDGQAREAYRSVGQLGILHDASPDGRLLVHQGFERIGVRAKQRDEDHERELGVFSLSVARALSEDGKQLLITEGPRGGVEQTFLRSVDGGPPVRLGEGSPLAISPRGKWVLLGTLPNLLPLTLVPTGAGEPRPLVTEGIESIRYAWFVDEERVVVGAHTTASRPRSFLLDPAGKAPRPITPEGMYAVPGFYAGGTVIGWSVGEGTFARLSTAGAAPRPLPGQVHLPHYPVQAAADGRSVFVMCGGVPRRVERLDLVTGKRTLWKSLIPDEPVGVVLMGAVLLTPDGRGYAYSYGQFLQDLFVIGGLRE